MINLKNVFFQTENLLIREITPFDAVALEGIRLRINDNPANRPYYDLKDPGDATRFCKTAMAQQKATPRVTVGLAVTEKKDPSTMIGFVIGELEKLDKDEWKDENAFVDLGYFLDPKHQDKGYIVEALRGMVGKVFIEELGYESISATVHPDNPASLYVLKALGMEVYGKTTKYGEPRQLLKVEKADFYGKSSRDGVKKNLIQAEKTKIIAGFLPRPEKGR